MVRPKDVLCFSDDSVLKLCTHIFQVRQFLLCNCCTSIALFCTCLYWDSSVCLIYLPEHCTQGDVLRHSLLMRYFGKSFVNKRETVELSPHPPVTHGPGGKLVACFSVCKVLYVLGQHCSSNFEYSSSC